MSKTEALSFSRSFAPWQTQVLLDICRSKILESLVLAIWIFKLGVSDRLNFWYNLRSGNGKTGLSFVSFMLCLDDHFIMLFKHTVWLIMSSSIE